MSVLLLTILTMLTIGCSPDYNPLKVSANPENLRKHVESLVYDKQYRNFEDVDELNRVSRYIKQEIEKNDFSCTYQLFEVNDKAYRNVVCNIQSDLNNIFVVGAHYDVCGVQEGADDNASGVAGVIELSRILNAQRDQLKTNIQLVAFTLEEPPFFGTENMGSFIHAKSLHDNNSQVSGMIALEMIGYFSQEEIQHYPPLLSWFYPKKANFIAAVSNFGSVWMSDLYAAAQEDNSDIEVEKLSAPASIEGVDFSDHRNFWKFDYDAIMITDTAFFRNKNYHKTTDTIETLNFKNMAKIVDGVAMMLLSANFK